MSLITKLPDRLCEWFSDMAEFSTYTFCTTFPSSTKATPLTKPVVVFGTKSVEILDNAIDETGSIITDSRIAEEKFSISIHVPRANGGVACCEILDRLMDLLLYATPLQISNIESAETKYIRNTDSLNLTASFTVSETINKGSIYPTALII
ncbi:MAG: hypothetical protein IJZ35_02170 [Clostridia bacterium]|nr:hypothetical protein [Clostridia bacterium]